MSCTNCTGRVIKGRRILHPIEPGILSVSLGIRWVFFVYLYIVYVLGDRGAVGVNVETVCGTTHHARGVGA